MAANRVVYCQPLLAIYFSHEIQAHGVRAICFVEL